MKKVLVLGGFALFAMTSCKKDFTCTCKFPTQNSITPPNAVTNYEDMKKKDAESKCDELQASPAIQALNGTCSID